MAFKDQICVGVIDVFSYSGVDYDGGSGLFGAYCGSLDECVSP